MREDKLRRLLQAVYKPGSPPPEFKERLLKRLLERIEGLNRLSHNGDAR
jgi:hypothetical protein